MKSALRLTLFGLTPLFIQPFLHPIAYAQDSVISEITIVKEDLLERTSTTSELSGPRLSRQQRSTLGETLSRQTGVNSSQFGPNASRPVVRGLDGERVRILQNGTGVLDASAASQDHAVAADPLIVERIEVVQGPAALLYGNSTIGGVVNILVRRIPESRVARFQGAADNRFASNDNGRSAGILLEGPLATSENWVYHFDGTSRAADDYKAPQGTVTNSFNRTLNGAFGTSYVQPEIFAGVSLATYDSQYGTVAEKAVNIDMKQRRFDFSGGLKNVGWFDSAKLKSTLSDYHHREINDGQTGTTFKNYGHENRLDLKHRKHGVFEGVFGLQQNFFTFEALGDEAFLPRTDNSAVAAFVFEEADLGRLKPSLAVRVDKSSVATDSTTKTFTSSSASLGVRYAMNDLYSTVVNVSHTQRAPNYQEIFANGPHVATGVFEVGDPRLNIESSQSAEISLRAKDDVSNGTATVFAQDFQNFIALSPIGSTDAGTGLPISNYQGLPARMYGGELEFHHKLPHLIKGGECEIEAKIDFVRGFNRQTGTSLPRQPALRETLVFNYRTEKFQVDAEIQRSEKQTDLAPGESETGGFNLVNLGVEVPFSFEDLTVTLMVRGLNIFDADARNHVSILKEIAPLPGRSFTFSAQATF